jgi:hypothetical protein
VFLYYCCCWFPSTGTYITHAKAGKFRRLVGTMSPIDTTSDEAEIYVEGKLHMIEGFIRWCQRSKIGLNQIITVKEVFEEEPTGMYDEFYAPTITNN